MRAALLLVLVGCSFAPGAAGSDAIVSDGRRDAPVGSGDATGMADATSFDAPVACPSQYSYTSGGHHYRRTLTDLATWPEAAVDCALDGGHLVKIETANESSYIASIGGTSFIWIGLADPLQNNQLKWTDGTALGAYNGFPSMTVPTDMGQQDCVDQATSGGAWALYTCGTREEGICECE